jgi:four helix bundle protein
MQDPRKVKAWQAAIQIAVRTRALVAHFPRRGYSELRAQMTSSAESISHNFAEGCSAPTPADYCKYLGQAAKSASELSSQIDLAMTYDIVPQREAFALNGSVIVTRRMIRALEQVIRADEVQKSAARRRGNGRSKKQATDKPPANETN